MRSNNDIEGGEHNQLAKDSEFIWRVMTLRSFGVVVVVGGGLKDPKDPKDPCSRVRLNVIFKEHKQQMQRQRNFAHL